MRKFIFAMIIVSGFSVVSYAEGGHKCGLHKKGDKAAVSCKHEKKCVAELEACKKKCDGDEKCIKKCERKCKKECKIKKAKAAEKTTDASEIKNTMKPQTMCPVMGGAINKKLFVDANGKRIYVCCEGCIDAVKKDPDKYLKKMADEGVKVEDAPM